MKLQQRLGVSIVSVLVVFWAQDPGWPRAKIEQLISPLAATEVAQTKRPPIRLNFPSLDQEVVVAAGVIEDGDWDLYEDQAAWLATSAVPGEGNVIIYAHNRKGLFADLEKLKKNDEVVVGTDAGEVRYLVTQSKAVKPGEVEAVLSDEQRLTLFTCEGTFDQVRRVVYAKLI